MEAIQYKEAKIMDIGVVTDLLRKLYGDDRHTEKELFTENKAHFTNPTQAFFLGYDRNTAVGVAHVAIRREYVEGSRNDVCGYLEAIYVEPEYRCRGVARNLVIECEKWSGLKGCTLFASDCELENTESYHFHIGIGFIEASRNIHFIKALPVSFRDAKANMDMPAVRRMIADAAFDGTADGVNRKINAYRANEKLMFYGYTAGNEIVGICGFEEHPGKIEIHLIATDGNARGKGIGKAMIKGLKTRYHKPIEAETDDDAVIFYRKAGFSTTPFDHPKYGRRWTCFLPYD